MKNKLIELIKDVIIIETWDNGEFIDKSVNLEEIAEYLLANGVIVLSCKVGDKYLMDTAKTIFKAWNDVTGAVCDGTSWYYELESVIEDIVKLSFGAGVLYREEAEQALKGGAK